MNILIVDDDTFVIQKIAEGIDWEEIGIKRVFTADNVRQAYKIFETFPVDILVTDIEMPQGSGLELLEWVKEKKYPVESLVLSGYAHFAYAQKAMQYGSREYMLKPISNRELAAAVRKIVQEKEKGYIVSDRRKEILSVCEELYTLPAERLDLVRECVVKRKLYRGDERFCLVMLRILSGNGRGQTNQRLLDFVIRNVLREFFENKGLEMELERKEQEGKWLLVFRENGRLSSLKECTVQMQKCLHEVVQLESCVYIGRLCGLKEMIQSYQALAGICEEAVVNERGMFCEEAWSVSDQSCRLPDFDRLGELLQAEGMISSVRTELIEYIRKLSQENSATVSRFREISDGLMRMIYQVLRQRNISPSQLFNEEELNEVRKRSENTVKWMLEFIGYLFDKLEGFQSINGSKKEYLVERLKAYIAEHLSEDLSRGNLSRVVYLSEDYVSKLFAAETGMSIPNYVAGQRMERAKQYLSATKLTVSEIAMRVGYSNFSYFSKSFKDYTGKTPNEYRIYIKNLSNYQ